MSWWSDDPEDETISLFAGLLVNPDVPLSLMDFIEMGKRITTPGVKQWHNGDPHSPSLGHWDLTDPDSKSWSDCTYARMITGESWKGTCRWSVGIPSHSTLTTVLLNSWDEKKRVSRWDCQNEFNKSSQWSTKEFRGGRNSRHKTKRFRGTVIMITTVFTDGFYDHHGISVSSYVSTPLTTRSPSVEVDPPTITQEDHHRRTKMFIMKW